ncbi:MAG: NTP transferase domain-containing protein [Desulfobulbaceae bacterium]|nr:NTP transferase domain-containing protein [Desulfobulbaceae bacterium]
MDNITAIILAAGKGTRMKSDTAKVLHELFFKPMLHHVMDAVQAADISRTAVIVGHQRERVIHCLRDYSFIPVTQGEQLGTGHAVLCAEQVCGEAGTILILCGDTPLIRTETLNAMIRHHRLMNSELTLMTTVVTDPTGYGRIITDRDGQVRGIVEEKDADDRQRQIREINAGIYLVDREFLFTALRQVGTGNSQGEVYLTDIVAIANRQGMAVNRFVHGEPVDVLGINSRVELARAHAEMQRRRNTELMLAGVTMYGPETILVAQNIQVGRDTIIHPGVRITGNSRIGSACILEPGVSLHDCEVADNATVGARSSLSGVTVEPSRTLPPGTCRDGGTSSSSC